MSSSLFPRDPELHPSNPGLIFETRQPVPTVVVKRRRLAGTPQADEGAESATAGEPSTARDPKVFRVEAAAVALPAVAAAAPAPQAAPQRRKRDPLRAPVLLRHEVMAPPPAEPAPRPEAAGASDRSVCEAIERARRELDRVGQARRIRLSLP